MKKNNEISQSYPGVSLQASGLKTLVENAGKAQAEWASLHYKERSIYLKKVEKYLGQHADEFTEIICKDTGKLQIDAISTEVLPAIIAIKYYRKQGKRFISSKKIPGSSILMFNKKSTIVYKPYGVVGIISPWNYPFSIPFSEIVTALLTGNAVILKVASNTLNVGRAIKMLFSNIGLPENLFSYVELPGEEAGAAFINSGIDKLFFTGSTAVGKKLMALASDKLLPLVLELGGADAAIICADADIERSAAGIIWSGFSNAGQSCAGVQRVLVHQDIYEKFLEKLSDNVKKIRVGSSFDSDVGKIISLKQKKLVKNQVDECIKKGAKIEAQSNEGNLEDETLFAPAIVLTNISLDMPIMKEEIFGPVIGVLRVRDDEEALYIANNSSYGLTGSVWSKNYKKAVKIAEKIDAGAVMINDHLMSHGLPEAPWGGFGDSGFGRTHGKEGFMEMVKSKVIIKDTLPGTKRDIWWQPYSEKVYLGIKALIDFIASDSIAKRIKFIPKVIKIFFRYWKK